MAKIKDLYTVFTGVDGDPIDNGYIYIGAVGSNPETTPVSVYSDADLTVPVAQPIRTLSGRPAQSGAPINLYVEGANYSITVRDKNSTLIYSDLNFSDSITKASVLEFETLEDLIDGSAVNSGGSVDYADYTGNGATVRTVRTTVHNKTSNGGGAEYEIWSLANYRSAIGNPSWVPDGSGSAPYYGRDHYVGGATSYVAILSGPQVQAEAFGLIAGPTQNNTLSFAKLCQNVKSGDVIDFAGKEYRIFEGVTGIPSASATPGVDNAVTLAELPAVSGVDTFTFANGLVYAADQAVTATKSYYPCTIALKDCTNVSFINFSAEAKGESYGDSDASAPLSVNDRHEFLPYNAGNALLIARCQKVLILGGSYRLGGSTGSVYITSSAGVNMTGSFANPASLGYASYAIDSWVGDTAVTGFDGHDAEFNGCRAHAEALVTRETGASVGSPTYSSKGCVVSEDADVAVQVNGGYYADAYPNAASKDLGYAFGASSSSTTVNGATVKNCASIGWTGTSNGTDYTYLMVNNVYATGLRKTVHQTKDVSFGRMYWKYNNVEADVVGGGEWPGDGSLSREQTSYVAMANAAIRVGGIFKGCSFTGATYGFISDTSCFGQLKFSLCDIETNGYLWDTQNIGGGSAGGKLTRGITFDRCAIEDVSSETAAYTSTVSSTVYTYIDLRSSTIKLGTVRDIETSTIATPGTFIETYAFPRDEANVETLTGSIYLAPDSAKIQSLTPSGADRSIRLLRPDKYKFFRTLITNTDVTNNLLIKDYTDATTYLTLTPGQTAETWNDGVNDYAKLIA